MRLPAYIFDPAGKRAVRLEPLVVIMGTSIEVLIAQAEAWAKQDPDPDNQAEIAQLVSDRDQEGLEQRFGSELVFGTAGLRGFVGSGPNRMNRITVGLTTAGLAAQLKATVPDAESRGVVIGRDARHKSDVLAREAAEVLAGHGFVVHWIDGSTPTPVVAFAGRFLSAAASIVVTASHNPPEYNGFKVYSVRGSQIVSPQDRDILNASQQAGPYQGLPRDRFEDALQAGRLKPVSEEVMNAYFDALDAQCFGTLPPPADVRVVTTALHGVGHLTLTKALARRGFTDVHPVVAQAEPDPAFPTVAFPNPEEEGALDMALALAVEKNADLVLANDPDADRLCVAVPTEDGFRQLTGNELGALLGDWLLGEAKRASKLPMSSIVLTTIVSSQLLSKIAAHYGVQCQTTLTGFKWIWDRAIDEAEKGVDFRFGYEEALGYCVGKAVRDKDGISAAQALVELAASLKKEGETLLDRLAQLWARHDFHASSQVATVFAGLSGKGRIARVMDQLRHDRPSECLGSRIVSVKDLLEDGHGLPKSNVLIWELADGARLVFRPSGTEPKVKAYVEVCVPLEGGSVSAAEAAGLSRLDEFEDWIRNLIHRTS